MKILQVNNVSIKYITGDFKSIGLKEYVMRRLKGNYTVKEFWANKNITFNLEEVVEDAQRYAEEIAVKGTPQFNEIHGANAVMMEKGQL